MTWRAFSAAETGEKVCLPWQAIACRLLPGAHWALLYVIAVTFVLSFIMFESGGSFSNEGRHTLWTLLCALMVFVLTVRSVLCLRDGNR